MRRLRISIAGLGGVVLLAALGLAALRYASAWWAAAAESAALVLLGVSAVGSWQGQRARRPFWAGAFVFGGGYGALALVGPGPGLQADTSTPFKHPQAPEATLDAPGPRFLVDAMLDRLVPVLYPPVTVYTVSYDGQDIATIRGDASIADAYGPRIERAVAERTPGRAILYVGPGGELLDIRSNRQFGMDGDVGATFLHPIDLTDYDPDALAVATATDPEPTAAYRSSFLRAGHALVAVLIGLLGGIGAVLAIGPVRPGAGREVGRA